MYLFRMAPLSNTSHCIIFHLVSLMVCVKLVSVTQRCILNFSRSTCYIFYMFTSKRYIQNKLYFIYFQKFLLKNKMLKNSVCQVIQIIHLFSLSQPDLLDVAGYLPASALQLVCVVQSWRCSIIADHRIHQVDAVDDAVWSVVANGDRGLSEPKRNTEEKFF